MPKRKSQTYTNRALFEQNRDHLFQLVNWDSSHRKQHPSIGWRGALSRRLNISSTRLHNLLHSNNIERDWKLFRKRRVKISTRRKRMTWWRNFTRKRIKGIRRYYREKRRQQYRDIGSPVKKKKRGRVKKRPAWVITWVEDPLKLEKRPYDRFDR